MYCIVSKDTPISTWENLDEALLNIIALSRYTQPEQFVDSEWSIVDGYSKGCDISTLTKVIIPSCVRKCSKCGNLYPLSWFVGIKNPKLTTRECLNCQEARKKDRDSRSKPKPEGWKPFSKMSADEKREYLKGRSISIKRPGRDEPKVVVEKQPSAIEKRCIEDGVNMFRWSLWYYDLKATPIVDKMIWDYDYPDKVQCKHEGTVPDKGFRFVVYTTSKDKAIQKVRQYISTMAA